MPNLIRLRLFSEIRRFPQTYPPELWGEFGWWQIARRRLLWRTRKPRPDCAERGCRGAADLMRQVHDLAADHRLKAFLVERDHVLRLVGAFPLRLQDQGQKGEGHALGAVGKVRQLG